MILFFDRCMAKKVPELLRGCGLDARVHDDFFGPTTCDEDILAMVGDRGWPFFTCDDRMAKKGSSQRQAMSDHRVACFLLPGAGDRPPWDKIRMIARNWDAVLHAVRDRKRPFICKLYLTRHFFEQLPKARR